MKDVAECDKVLSHGVRSMKVICTVSGASMPVQQQYTYIGLPMFADKDLNVLVEEGREK